MQLMYHLEERERPTWFYSPAFYSIVILHRWSFYLNCVIRMHVVIWFIKYKFVDEYSLCFILEFWHIMYVRSNFFRKFNLYFIVNRTLPLLKSQSFPISLNRSSIWNNGIIIVYILVIIHYPQNKKFLAVWAIYTCIRKTNRVKYIPSDIKTEKYFRVLVKKFDLTIDCYGWGESQ